MERYYSCMIFVAVALTAVQKVNGQNCADISGTWYNQLGSEMVLRVHTDGDGQRRLMGEYRTAVERHSGSAGAAYSNIIGLAPETDIREETTSVFGFSVLWSGGNSSTTWLAQCLMCGGVEQIVTTWILRSRVDSCGDRWRAVMTGRSHFTRREQSQGDLPKAHRNLKSPSDLTEGRRRKRSINDVISEKLDNVKVPVVQASVNVEKAKPIDVDVDVQVDAQSLNSSLAQDGRPEVTSLGRIHGLWFNEIGSEMSLDQRAASTITGSYKTVSERMNRAGHVTSHSEIVGVGSPLSRDTTLSLLMSWNNGQSVTAWVGQVHVCQENNRMDEVLEAAFLHRSRIDHCHEEWKSTIHGHSTFRRTDPYQNGGEQIAVREFGEEPSKC